VGLPRWLNPQLGSLLEHWHLRCLRCDPVRQQQQGCHLRKRSCTAGTDWYLQPRLKHRSGRYHHSLDSCEKPDVLGRFRMDPAPRSAQLLVKNLVQQLGFSTLAIDERATQTGFWGSSQFWAVRHATRRRLALAARTSPRST
jgi:hypothetical protein